MKSLLFVFALIAASTCVRAQQFDNPVMIPVSYYGYGVCNYTPPGMNASFSFRAGSGGVSSASISNPQTGLVLYSSSLAMSSLIPGKNYNVTVTSSFMAVVIVVFLPVDGCDIYINGNKTTSWSAGSANYSFTLRLEKINDLTQSLAGKRGGKCSSFVEDKPIWYIGLGSLRNGRFAGGVGIRAPAITPDLYTTSALIYDTVDAAEVSVTRTGGYITQIQSRDVVVNVDPYVANGTSYQIRVCQSGTPTTPFITYTVSQYTVSGGTGIRIDKLEDGVNWSTVLQYVSGTWTLYDWRVAAPGNPIDTSNPITTVVNGARSTVTYGSQDGGTVVKQKNYTTVGSFTELASTVMGPGVTSPPTSTYTYYNSSSGSGWYDAVQSITYPTGNWVAYDYYNVANDTRDGLIQHIYHPWLNAPASPTFNPSVGKVETYSYTTNYDGAQTAKSSWVTTVNGTPVAQKTWAYNWNYATVNSHTIAQVTKRDYSSSSAYLTTTILKYLPNDSVSFFKRKRHSVTRADGTTDSYAYYAGTWNASTYTFTPGAGNDWLTLVFHGQTGSSTTSWTVGSTTWTLAPLALVADLSTVTETVTDTNGRQVFEAENIYNGSGIERIAGTARTYNGNNLITAKTDIIRSLTGHPVAVNFYHVAGLLQTKTAADGTQTTNGYDNYLRKTSIALSGSGSFPSTTQNFGYYSSGLKNTAQETPRDPTTTTYAYESSGRLLSASIPEPGGGTLTQSYSYPSNQQTVITLPTNATVVTNFYLDGHVSETNGTGQVDTCYNYANPDSSYSYATTEYAGSLTNGWTEVKTDWLGRTVTVRTPEWGWNAGAATKVLRKTYGYSATTGQLLSLSTVDEFQNSASVLPTHIYVYGNMGLLAQEGDDVNNSGSLEPSSTDRITLYNTYYYKDTSGYNGWLRDDQAQIYKTLNSSATIVTVSEKRTRFTRFNNGALLGNFVGVSDAATIDASGRTTSDLGWVDPTDRQQLSSHTLQGDSTSGTTYLQDGYLDSTSSISGVTQNYTYESDGLLSSVTEGTTGAKVSYAYYLGTDFQYTVNVTTGASTSATTSYSYAWDTTRHTTIAAATDAAGGIAYSETNALGLSWHTWGSAAQPTEIEYDNYGRRTGITTWQSGTCWTGTTWPSSPPAGNLVSWTLDPASGLASQKTFPDTSYVQYTYNARGQLLTRVWARNVTTNYAYYDTVGSQTGELHQVSYSDGTPAVTYAYTRWGTPATITDATGSRSFAYGSDLKLNTETLDTSFYNGHVITTNHDSLGRYSGYSFNGDSTIGLSYDFDPASGRKQAVHAIYGNGVNWPFAIGYAPGTDFANSVSYGSYSRTMTLVPQYDVLSNVTTSLGGTQLGNFTAQYTDPRGWRDHQIDNASLYTTTSALNLVSGLTNAYLFDNFGQLRSSTGSSGARSFSWTYDLAGNRLTDTSNGAGTNYVQNSLNQYTSITGNLAEGTPLYDADGNMTSDATWNYAYDGENRLVSMTRKDSSQALAFQYDYMGRRVHKTVTGANASELKFVWSRWKLLADLNPNGYSIVRSYVWGPDFSDGRSKAGGAGSLLAVFNQGVPTFAVPDAFGNIVAYANTSGAFTAAVEYLPYGRVNNSYVASGENLGKYPIGFSGQYTDWETGMSYYGNRYYNPKHGRFVNRDPIEEAGGYNLYGFCRNNPCNCWDRRGNDPSSLVTPNMTDAQTENLIWGVIVWAQRDNGATQLPSAASVEETASETSSEGDAAASPAGSDQGAAGDSTANPAPSDPNTADSKSVDPNSASTISMDPYVCTCNTETGLTTGSVNGNIVAAGYDNGPSEVLDQISGTWSSSDGPNSSAGTTSGNTWGNAFGMFGDWATGMAPKMQVYGPNTWQTQGMMNAPGVQRALDYFYKKNAGNAPDQQQSVTDYGVGFGLKGLWQAGNNPIQQFVGNYRVDLYPNADGNISVQLTNTTSLTSFLYGLWPNALNMPNGYSFGNSSQLYVWTVPNKNVPAPTRPPGSGAGGTW